MAAELNRKNDYSLRIMRIFACFMVVLLHTSADWGGRAETTISWRVLNFYDSLSRCCVPVFFMISGALFLSREKISLKWLWRKKILRLVILYILFLVFYAVTETGIHKAIKDPSLLWEAIQNPSAHLWFIRAILPVYALSPIIHQWVQAADRETIRYYLLLFFLFGVLFETIDTFAYDSPKLKEFLDMYFRFDMVGYIGYFILGYYLYRFYPCRKQNSAKCFLLFIGTAVFSAAFNAWYCREVYGRPLGFLYGYFCVTTFFEAVFFFLAVRSAFPEESEAYQPKTRKVVSGISKGTLYIYLIHIFVKVRLAMYCGLKVGFAGEGFSMLWQVPLLSLIYFMVSLPPAFFLLWIEKVMTKGRS